MPQMVCAVGLGALAGFVLMGGGHASFPGLWAGSLAQSERRGVDLIASMVGLCLFMSLWLSCSVNALRHQEKMREVKG